MSATPCVGIGPNTHGGNDSFTVDFSLSNASSTALRMANYRTDYTTGTQPARWRYLWNAPTDWNGSSSSDGSTGNITDLLDYELLQAAGASWHVDGDTSSGNGSPGRFLQLNATGGHPGRADGQDEVPPLTVANGHDRYAIAAYDVPESGYYSIRDSFFDTLGPNGDGSDVRVYTNLDPANPVFDGSFDNVTDGSFDAAVGFLNPGDSIYVAVGTNGHDGVDSFEFDFSVYYSQVPEPATGTLVILGGLLLRRLHRRA